MPEGQKIVRPSLQSTRSVSSVTVMFSAAGIFISIMEVCMPCLFQLYLMFTNNALKGNKRGQTHFITTILLSDRAVIPNEHEESLIHRLAFILITLNSSVEDS